MGYKWCAVAACKNTTIKTPNKLFVTVPKNTEKRKKWLKLARRNVNDIQPNSSIYFCEDHFNLPCDMENYMQYKIMGSVKNIRMKPGCMPSRFVCHKKEKKSLPSNTFTGSPVLKSQRAGLIKETESSLPIPKESYVPVVLEANKQKHSDNLLTHKLGDSELQIAEDSICDEKICPKREAWSDSEPQPAAALGAQGGLRDSHGIPCNVCNEDIKGFRYTCVQCLDVDLCDACEMRQAHATHYVLRIPGPRPLEEVRQVLQRARRELAQALSACDEPEVVVKTEIKEELEDPLDVIVEPNSRPHESNILEHALLSIELPGPACPAPPTPTRAHARRTDTHSPPGTSINRPRPPLKRRLSPVEHTQTHTSCSTHALPTQVLPPNICLYVQTTTPRTQTTATHTLTHAPHTQIQTTASRTLIVCSHTETPEQVETPAPHTQSVKRDPDTTDTSPGPAAKTVSVEFEVFTHSQRRKKDGPKDDTYGGS